MLAFAARAHLMLWPAGPALLALAVTSLGTLQGGWVSAIAWGVTFSLGFPFVVAAQTVAGWMGPERGAWILPLALPLGLLPYLAADALLRRLVRRRSRPGAEPDRRTLAGDRPPARPYLPGSDR